MTRVLFATEEPFFGAKEINSIIEGFKGDKTMEFAIKIRPVNDLEHYKNVFGKRARILQNTDLYTLIKENDVVVCQNSTVGIEAMALGVPFISFKATSAIENLYSKKCLFEAKNIKELKKQISYATNERNFPALKKEMKKVVEFYAGPMDGKACERIINEIKGGKING